MKKVVAESLNEYWVSSDTGVELYADYIPTKQSEPKSMDLEDFESMIPPPTIKMTPEDFDNYITELIHFIPQSPMMVIKIFNAILNTHPYLTKKPIGFKSTNPYESTINKFITAFKTLTQK